MSPSLDSFFSSDLNINSNIPPTFGSDSNFLHSKSKLSHSTLAELSALIGLDSLFSGSTLSGSAWRETM